MSTDEACGVLFVATDEEVLCDLSPHRSDKPHSGLDSEGRRRWSHAVSPVTDVFVRKGLRFTLDGADWVVDEPARLAPGPTQEPLSWWCHRVEDRNPPRGQRVHVVATIVDAVRAAVTPVPPVLPGDVVAKSFPIGSKTVWQWGVVERVLFTVESGGWLVIVSGWPDPLGGFDGVTIVRRAPSAGPVTDAMVDRAGRALQGAMGPAIGACGDFRPPSGWWEGVTRAMLTAALIEETSTAASSTPLQPPC